MLQATKGSGYAQAQDERLRLLERITNGSEDAARNRDIDTAPAPPTHEEIASSYRRNALSGKSITYHSSVQANKTTDPDTRTNAPIGVDTLRIWTDDFTLAEAETLTGLEHHEKTDLDTGEAKAKATLNNELFRATIYDTALVVEANLPKLNAHHNEQTTRGREGLAIAITKLERELEQHGIQTDLTAAKLSRLDIASTQRLPLTVPEYDKALDLCTYPRMDVNRYGQANRTWKNTKRQLCLYDKGLDLEGKASNLARLEYRLMKSDAIQRHTDCVYVGDLLMHPKALRSAYLSATRKLFDVEGSPMLKADSETTSEAFRAVLDDLQDERGAYTKALLALATAQLDGSTVQAFEQVVRETLGRQAMYRFRTIIQDAQQHADAYRDAERTVTDRLAHLKDAFA